MKPAKRERESDEIAESDNCTNTTTALKYPSVLLNDGHKMPTIGLGTFRARKQKCAEAVALAIQVGYRLIDTARGYGNEEFVAQGIATSGIPRSQLFITTKVPKDAMNGKGVIESHKLSLAALQTDYIDLLLLHWPGGPTTDPKSASHAKRRIEAWKAMVELQQSGTVRSIGVSNYTVEHLEHLAKHSDVVPAVNQVEVHPYLTQDALREYCAKRGIHVQGYTSMGRNLEPPAVVYGKREPDHERIVKDPTLLGIAKDRKMTPNQVCLRWSLQLGVSVIPKSVTLSHIKENWVGCLGEGDLTLSEDDMKSLSALNRNLHYAWDPTLIQ